MTKIREKILAIIFLLFLLFLFNCISFNNEVYAEDNPSKRILIIDSYHKGFKWSDDCIIGIKTSLKKSYKNVSFIEEYMDTKRISGEEYLEKLKELYAYKYKEGDIDIIVTVGDAAYEFLNKYHEELSPNIPVVFCGTGKLDKSQIKYKETFTGILEKVGIEETVDAIVNIHSELEEVRFILDKSESSEVYIDNINKLKDSGKYNFKFNIIRSNTVSSTIEQMENAPQNAVAFIFPMYLEDFENYTNSLLSVKAISKGSNIPIYTAWADYTNYGIVGGKLFYGYFHGFATGGIVNNILKGKKVSEIEISEINTSKFMFDNNELERYNIDQNKLPENSKIINLVEYVNYSETTIKKVIISIIITLSIIIVILLFNVIMRKKAESISREKQRLLNKMEEYDELRSEFFANVSHELRTPLNVILSALQYMKLLQKDGQTCDNNDQLIKYQNIITQNSYRLLKLINNLIDMTKIDAGFYELEVKNHNIVTVVEDITLSVADYIERKGVQLIFDTDVEEKIVACDPEKIERIILNLLSNAIKFTDPGGGIYVNIYDKDEEIQISVRDTGVGIPKEKQEDIFERFIQVDSTLSRNKQGSGIGLSLVKALVELHEGEIWVESEVGEGTEFIITMPVKMIENDDVEANDISITNEENKEKVVVEFSDI